MLINDSADRARSVKLRIPNVSGPAALALLRAPAVGANTGVTLGGQSFGVQSTTGLLAGQPRAASVVAAGGSYVVQLPPASAAMLTLGATR